jgi:ribosomal protein S18 acetylase RimI-like enzyme
MSTLHDIMHTALASFARRGTPATAVTLTADDPWALDLRFALPDGDYRLRALTDDDEAALWAFSRGLGAVSRDLFGPYPWHDDAACGQAFRAAIAQATARVDTSYLLEHDGATIGHGFLWKAGGNPVSRAAGLQVPELGVAVADRYHGRGFGGLLVRTLQAVGRALDADAIELTTAQTNASGWHTYLRAGFVYVGILRIPLGVDVTAAEAGTVQATRFRDERQMVDIIREARRDDILRYLAAKRAA